MVSYTQLTNSVNTQLTKFFMSIRKEIQKSIEASGISANALSEAVGLSQPTISRFLRGNDVKLSVAETLAAYFNLELRQAETKPTVGKSAKSTKKK